MKASTLTLFAGLFSVATAVYWDPAWLLIGLLAVAIDFFFVDLEGNWRRPHG